MGAAAGGGGGERCIASALVSHSGHAQPGEREHACCANARSTALIAAAPTCAEAVRSVSAAGLGAGSSIAPTLAGTTGASRRAVGRAGGRFSFCRGGFGCGVASSSASTLRPHIEHAQPGERLHAAGCTSAAMARAPRWKLVDLPRHLTA